LVAVPVTIPAKAAAVRCTYIRVLFPIVEFVGDDAFAFP